MRLMADFGESGRLRLMEERAGMIHCSPEELVHLC